MFSLRTNPVRPAGWLAGLDGLRAIAVVAVLLFHFAPESSPGGFLGVDLFFAISGFLITRLLLEEIRRTGQLNLLGFYRRRWRRLMPAVFALLVAVAVASLSVWRDELPTLRGGLLASASFVTNWWLIFDHQSYFVATGRPSMLAHLWSLAIEEQFYLLWPLLLAALVGFSVLGPPRRAGAGAAGRLSASERAAGYRLSQRALGRVALTSGLLGVGSAVLMAVIAVQQDIPYGADSGRVYFGTDTHSSGLLFGAALGALSLRRPPDSARPWRQGWQRRWRTRLGLICTDGIAVGALMLLSWQLLRVNQFEPALYRGGFAVMSLLSAVLVACVTRSGSRVGRLLDVAALRWIGQRSYALYLWQWPVAVVTRPGLDVTGPSWLLVVNQFAITLALAELSFRLVEQPFRRGTVQRWWAGYPVGRGDASRPRVTSAGRRWLAWGLTATCLLAAGGIAHRGFGRHDGGVVAGSYGGPSQIDTIGTGGPSDFSPAPSPSPSPPSTPPRTPARAARSGSWVAPHASLRAPTAKRTVVAPGKPAVAPAANPSAAGREAVHVTAFGDSVMLGAANALATDLPGIQISAVEGRQARAVFQDIDHRVTARALSPVVVIHTGDNGIISPTDLRTTLARLQHCSRIVLVTPRVNRDWEGPNLTTLLSIGRSFDNVRIVNWNSLSVGHADWFYRDGIHLPPLGATQYAGFITAAVHAP